jgi:hypothetical protein
MPKKYRVEMTLVDDATSAALDTDVHEETYADDAKAKREFDKKTKAARDTGRGSGPGPA